MKAVLASLILLCASTIASPIARPQDAAPDVATKQNTTVSADPDGFGHGKGGGGAGGGAPNSPLNVLLAAVGKLPVIGVELKVIGDLLTTVEATLAKTLGVDTTESESGCTAMTVIFARGTTEPGNVGLVTGPPFFDALKAMLGAKSVTIQGVNYGATIEGFLEGGEPDGGTIM